MIYSVFSKLRINTNIIHSIHLYLETKRKNIDRFNREFINLIIYSFFVTQKNKKNKKQ